MPRLCFLTFDPGTLKSTRFAAFFQTLRELGFVDGQSITIDYLSAGGDGKRFSALAAECLRLNADIIAVSTTPATEAAKNATQTIPIVMIALGDPVGTRLVESLAKPGANVTGMSMMVPELAAKRLELLKEAVPSSSRILVLSYLADPIAPLQVKAMQDAARSLRVTLHVHDIRSADELPAAFEAGAKQHVDSLVITAESIFRVEAEHGNLPFVLLLNKSDLQQQWAIHDTELDNLRRAGWSVRSSSARTGEGVEDAFRELAVRVAAPK
jgi:putative ABC transport system substrate-binding protein